MFSAIFIDRPRLAAVIAILTTIAGLLSLLVIPVAQYPDVVPPQVSLTTTYPGASAAVVDATIAQPIESQVVGVDKMIYMKSVSGNDGSYSLKVSFELGTDADIDTVNVNNRVQVAISKLPEDVRRQGVTVKKQSSALLGVVALYSPKQTHDELFISNYATINLLDQIKSTPGIGDATLFGPQDYAMRVWVRTDRLTGLGLTTADVVSAIQSQNVQAAVGRIGARPISNDQPDRAKTPVDRDAGRGWPRRGRRFRWSQTGNSADSPISHDDVHQSSRPAWWRPADRRSLNPSPRPSAVEIQRCSAPAAGCRRAPSG